MYNPPPQQKIKRDELQEQQIKFVFKINDIAIAIAAIAAIAAQTEQ